ncbi:MAG TPA: TolC family protein [Burkholderiales bacterium]|nr:TolC family protein [Burkholderiales bacterium]
MRALCSLLVLTVAGGCALKDPPKREDIGAQALPNLKVPESYAALPAPAPAQPAQAGWLAAFGDAQLDALVQETLANNPDLQVAAARVEQAASFAKAAGATLWPQVNALLRGGGALSGDSSGLEGGGIFANWELDVWGRVRSGRAAARDQHGSAQLDAEYARQSLAALVAKSWFLASEARLQRMNAEEMAAASEKQLGLAQDRLRVGRGDEYDVALARANLATFRDSVVNLELAYRQAVRALEALAGRYPAAQLSVPAQLALLPGPIPVGMPSELLERRPDIVAAERRVAAAFYRVQEAKAARLPRISLTAAVTSISSELFVLKDRDNPVWSAGASLTAPLFTGGALQSQVEIRSAEQKQAVAEYGRVGSRAFGEVETALSTAFALDAREAILREAVVDNARALELANVRFRVGAGDLRAVQQQSLALHAARTALLRVQAERLVQRVNLHLALGGSFSATPP